MPAGDARGRLYTPSSRGQPASAQYCLKSCRTDKQGSRVCTKYGRQHKHVSKHSRTVFERIWLTKQGCTCRRISVMAEVQFTSSKYDEAQPHSGCHQYPEAGHNYAQYYIQVPYKTLENNRSTMSSCKSWTAAAATHLHLVWRKKASPAWKVLLAHFLLLFRKRHFDSAHGTALKLKQKEQKDPSLLLQKLFVAPRNVAGRTKYNIVNDAKRWDAVRNEDAGVYGCAISFTLYVCSLRAAVKLLILCVK